MCLILVCVFRTFTVIPVQRVSSFFFCSSSEVSGPSKLSKEHKALLLDYLGIDRDLAFLESSGLCSSYQKFKAIVDSTPKVMSLGKDEEWKAQFDGAAVWVPNLVTFIEIFIAKSQFYQFGRPLFLRAQEYLEMRDWLDEAEDCLSTKDLWEIKVVQRKHKKVKQARDSEEEEEEEASDVV
ncbi:uncharacterized protein LACBIDRAFT_334112 [Laccaria bicolor S238N-H82]|uniref:Predicted protein n=1 Tax=Laccaria bicolor (strain S238N-H82 / ATCC MYA-4686) TaxID=486041 RepID=B0DY44_LACBS|nr:uncharacterized protein LACBIDRAFT_334112 [Laccaria bicolor S238N-H82]EDR00454.1 predicted protein [Laccaria bicolor S238N-H82]|eukprot:XP_001888846.1 predicted protein [Laccaria bicolor S238N-H82]